MHRFLLGVVALAASTDALACGGFFCQSLAQPVDQAGERILFAVDEASARVEVQVQISYTGTADQFAWLLPTPTEPTIATTVDDVFRVLGAGTFPQWQLSFVTEGTCKGQGKGLFPMSADSGGDVDVSDTDGAGGGGVRVTSQSLVGPYESTVLQADDAQLLVDWLQAHDYYVPDAIAPKLQPYIATNSYFVALRLQKQKDTGDLVPVAVTYPGTTPQIPLVLTSVAAAPDMPLQPFVLASARAVPDNYLHVNVNPFAIDWINGGQNYFDVVTRAADEAGGQAFATDFSGPSSLLAGAFAAPGAYQPELLRGHTDAYDVLLTMQSAGFPLTAGTLPIADALLEPPLPSGKTLQGELAALRYVEALEAQLYSRTIDGDALAAALATDWVAPMAHVEDLVGRLPQLTRLTSSISADEMTVDPSFALNPDMGDVARAREATVVTHCNVAVTTSEARRSLRLPDGREMWYPDGAFGNGQFDWQAWLGTVQANATETIERTSATGAPVLIADNRDAIAAELAALDPHRGCGCDSTRATGWLASVLPALALLRRRRRSG